MKNTSFHRPALAAACFVALLGTAGCKHSTGNVLGDEAQEWAMQEARKPGQFCEELSDEDFKLVDQGMLRMGNGDIPPVKVVVATYSADCMYHANGKKFVVHSTSVVRWGHHTDGFPNGELLPGDFLERIEDGLNPHIPLDQK